MLGTSYTLMNKNTELLDFNMYEGFVDEIYNVRHGVKNLLPYAFINENLNSSVAKYKMQKWWSSRRIPTSRKGIKDVMWELRSEIRDSLDIFAEKSFGLSLSDQYWIRIDESIKWSDVNFFTNEFSEDIGKLLIGGVWSKGNSLKSPDNTSDGIIPKCWKIIEGDRFLMKGSSSSMILQPQPFREMLASRIAQILVAGLNKDFQTVVEYFIKQSTSGAVYSLCKNFITIDTEYVPIRSMFDSEGLSIDDFSTEEAYEFVENIFGEHADILELTLLLDFIVLNEDRHTGNLGMIRSSNTGELLYPAPIFDTGNSLFYDSLDLNYRYRRAKPFHFNFNRQMGLFDFSKYIFQLTNLKKELESIFNECFNECFEDETRLNQLLYILEMRIDMLLNNDIDFGFEDFSPLTHFN